MEATSSPAPKLKGGAFKCPMCADKKRPFVGAHFRQVLGLRKLVCWRHMRVTRAPNTS